jgi:hypothetical protein
MAQNQGKNNRSKAMGYSRVTKVNENDIARGVTRYIIAALGDRDKSSIDSWVLAAKELGARVQRFYGHTGDDPGYYDPQKSTIYYDCLRPHWECLYTIVHELAHHVQTILPRKIVYATRLQRYDDNRQSVQHKVACLVEEMLLGPIIEAITAKDESHDEDDEPQDQGIGNTEDENMTEGTDSDDPILPCHPIFFCHEEQT